MSWLICGEDKQGNPFAFEANSVKGSCRVALGQLLEAQDLMDSADILRAHQSLVRKPGLYTLMWDNGSQLFLAGFWIVFGHHYLEDGPFGPPDKTPPYVEEILEALTEEVWWKKSFCISPKINNGSQRLFLNGQMIWLTVLRFVLRVFHFPTLNLHRKKKTTLVPSFGWSVWKKRAAPEAATPAVTVGQWAHLPVNRSLLLVVKGTMKYSRIRHEGSFQMVPAECFGDLEQVTPKVFPTG